MTSICNYWYMYLLSPAPSSSPGNVSATVNSSIEILVTWEEVSPLTQNGIIVTYEVLYEPLETFNGQLQSQTLNSTDLFAYLTGLEEFVNYSISVKAYTSVGSGPYSEHIYAKTLEDSNLR